jgi:hypothetical protein
MDFGPASPERAFSVSAGLKASFPPERLVSEIPNYQLLIADFYLPFLPLLLYCDVP